MSNTKNYYLLLAPKGQLSGNGQLRETFKERRNRLGMDTPIWYLSSKEVEKYSLSEFQMEGVVSSDLKALQWLKLRFGGEVTTHEFNIDDLSELASELPPEPFIRDISVN